MLFRSVLFILLELRAAYGEGDGEHAEAGIQVRGIRLDIVDADAEGADGRDEARQIELVFQLQMHLKMVRAVLQMCFERRKARHTAQQREKQHQRQRIQSRAERQPHDAAAPEADGGRQALDLVLGGILKFSSALALREATTVSSAFSTPGHRNMRIGTMSIDRKSVE